MYRGASFALCFAFLVRALVRFAMSNMHQSVVGSYATCYNLLQQTLVGFVRAIGMGSLFVNKIGECRIIIHNWRNPHHIFAEAFRLSWCISGWRRHIFCVVTEIDPGVQLVHDSVPCRLLDTCVEEAGVAPATEGRMFFVGEI